MNEALQLGELVITVTRKPVKHIHLSVRPPDGRVTLIAPPDTRSAVLRSYAATRLSWIRDRQASFKGQAREAPRRYRTRESHWVWGRRYLLIVVERDEKPSVTLKGRRMVLSVRPATSVERRAEVISEWQRGLLHAAVPGVIKAWERRLGVEVSGYFLQRMKTQWGSCNPTTRNIRLNTELARKPADLLEYVVVHEMLHLLEPRHSARFVELLYEHYPSWREARANLNELPLSDERWPT